MNFQPGDKVKTVVPGTLQITRTLKRRMSDMDDNILGECWEFEEDNFHSYDWDNFYELVERPTVEVEIRYCRMCGLPLEVSNFDNFCDGGCSGEYEENQRF